MSTMSPFDPDDECDTRQASTQTTRYLTCDALGLSPRCRRCYDILWCESYDSVGFDYNN